MGWPLDPRGQVEPCAWEPNRQPSGDEQPCPRGHSWLICTMQSHRREAMDAGMPSCSAFYPRVFCRLSANRERRDRLPRRSRSRRLSRCAKPGTKSQRTVCEIFSEREDFPAHARAPPPRYSNNEGLESRKRRPASVRFLRPRPLLEEMSSQPNLPRPQGGGAVRLAARSRSGYPTEAIGSACPHPPAPSPHPPAPLSP